jgi:hypothetical protein
VGKQAHSALHRNASNPRAEVWARICFLTCLIGFAVGPLLIAAGGLHLRADYALAGVLVTTAAGGIRATLRRRGYWEEASNAFDSMMNEVPAESGARVEHLFKLIEQWDALEAKRGSPGFDPWELQAVRHDIQVAVNNDPGLAKIFHSYERQKRMT